MKYLLRVEGVNLANVIDDTDQLSVRRGGGLMILNAAAELKDALRNSNPTVHKCLDEIATGASIGLFELESTDKEIEVIRTSVERHLKESFLYYTNHSGGPSTLPLKHGTFVVDFVPANEGGNVQQAEQNAVAKNRWRQLQDSSLSLDGLWDQGNVPCALDRTRVANTTCDLPEAPNSSVSKSARDRRDYGRGARQRFYVGEVGELANGLSFTDDLQQMAGMSDEERALGNVPSNLVDKLAVFYIDGNGFGQKGREIFEAHGTVGFREWSTKLRDHHRHILSELIAQAVADNEWKNGDSIRLETLLWGGDEILWVMPAWKGWEVAKWFFNQQHKIKVVGTDYSLTYGCGLVFCHAKAPIKSISALAHRLGDLAKEDRGDANVHRLAYEVLESYDDVSGDLEVHRKRFLPEGQSVNDLVIDPTKLSECWQDLIKVANSTEFPMRQVYMLAKAWRENRIQDMDGHVKRLRSACSDADVNIDKLLNAYGNPQGWLHLLQMLPYLPAELKTSQGACK